MVQVDVSKEGSVGILEGIDHPSFGGGDEKKDACVTTDPTTMQRSVTAQSDEGHHPGHNGT